VFTSIDGREDIRAHRTRRPAPQRLTEGEAVEIETAIADLLARESRRVRKRSHVDHFRERIAGLFVAGAERLGSPGDNVVPFRSAVTTARRVAEQVAARANSAVEFLAETWDRSANTVSGAQAPIADAHVRGALAECKRAFWSVAAFSAVVNLLMLAGPLYMLQVYDRVLSSRSVPTLVALSLFLVVAFAFQGALDIVRTRVVIRSALLLDEHLGTTVHRAVMRVALHTRRAAEAVQPVRDLDQIRAFLTGAGPIAIVDLPWMPVFLILCFLVHPLLGTLAFIGGIALFTLTVLTERASRACARAVSQDGGVRAAMLEADRRNSETIAAMGMAPALTARWQQLNARYLGATARSNDVVTAYGSVSKMVRLLLQSVMLGLGAYLVIRDELSSGGMIASSIMMTRALAPIETAIANWRGFVAARASIRRLTDLLDALRTRRTPTTLPRPTRRLEVDRLVVAAPGGEKAILGNIHFSVTAGEALGILGPSGTGKTSLVRTLLGIWPAARGSVRLDGAAIDQWDPDIRGRHIGYVSQSVELFDGTVAENIARMDPNADNAAVLRAAQAAGAHDMILRLPQGYDTAIGEMGAVLSGGQRQRIALARALYGDPFLLVLDEANANLDRAGDAALQEAIHDLKARGAIVLMIAHHPSAFSACDKILLLGNRTQQAFGPRDEVWRALAARHPAPGAGGLKVVSETGVDR
jgi:ATP-binding cassette, subfamily C, type I secretion system permease/ATPase